MNSRCLASDPEDHPRLVLLLLDSGAHVTDDRRREPLLLKSFGLSFQDFAWSIEVRVFVLLRFDGANE
jgi:hypothetical protein